MNQIIIDVETGSVKRCVTRLNNLVSTIAVHDYGSYREVPGYSQVYLETTKTVEEVEDWLYKYGKNIEYVGVIKLNPEE